MKNKKMLIVENLKTNIINQSLIQLKSKRHYNFFQLTIACLLLIYFIFYSLILYNKYLKIYNDYYLYIFITAHKDFPNKLTNSSYYQIICDHKTQLKNKYQLKIIEAFENNELFKKKRGYCEGSKIYYIWKKYKNGEISSKYIGFIHYRRIFTFRDNIPDLDKIFSHYDAIINRKIKFKTNIKAQFAAVHLGKFMDDIEDIIKENFTQYYSSAIKSLNNNSFTCCNIFIMKKKDFIKYGEFVFGVLFEFDRRHQLNNDNDIKNLMASEILKSGKRTSLEYQTRQEAFLMERISIIFYDYYFKNVLEIGITRQ